MSGTLCRVDVEIALIEHHGLIGVFNVDVPIRDVVDSTVAGICTGPGLQTSTVLDQRVSKIFKSRVYSPSGLSILDH